MIDDFDFFPFTEYDNRSPKTIDSKLKRAQSLVGMSQDNNRHPEDYYPTSPEGTEALLRVETFEGSIWENACGDGSICKVLKAHGYQDIIATDLIDRGYGEAPHDFLTSPYTADNIITNPPFKLAEEFVRRSLERTTKKVAILGKLQFLEGAKRKIMFETTPLKHVWVFSKRLTMSKAGLQTQSSGMIAFAWYVWDHSYDGKPMLGWL